MENTKVVYAFKNCHNAVSIVNYDTTNTELNQFIAKFDVWRSKGEHKKDFGIASMWFECLPEIWDMLHSTVFETAFERFDVKLVFEYPFERTLERNG